MGYNTTVVVLNDALAEIEQDPDFGKKLARAIRLASRGLQDVSAHGKHCMFANAAQVIETHHADYDVLVKIGGNTGSVVQQPGKTSEHTK
jgi:hypothetical protein